MTAPWLCTMAPSLTHAISINADSISNPCTSRRHWQHKEPLTPVLLSEFLFLIRRNSGFQSWYLWCGCFYSLLTNTSAARLVKAQFSAEGRGAAGRGQGHNASVWESFSPGYDKVPSIHTHAKWKKKKSSNKSKQPNIEN